MDEPIMTLKEAAEYLRVPPSTLYGQRYRREEPGCLGFKVGRRVRYRRADLEAWIEDQIESDKLEREAMQRRIYGDR